jgi:hypothetical protein
MPITPAILRSTVFLLLLRLFLRINMSVSVDHAKVATVPTTTSSTTTSIEECNVVPSAITGIDHSPKTTNEGNHIRHVNLPDRSILEDILFRYYGTNHDTYYEQIDHEEICRVRSFI